MSDASDQDAPKGQSSMNPFGRREEHARFSITTYKVLTVLSWALAVVTSVFYTFHSPGKHDGPHNHRIWKQNKYRATPFAPNSIIVSVYWIVLYIMQLGYVGHLYASNTTYVQAACNVGSHFITHNLMLFGFIMLWVRGHFWIAEILLIINFFNLSSAYFRHPKTPRFIHIPVVSGPLAWNFFALYWCGAAALNAHSLPARILANIAIWGVLVYGMFFLAAYKDYSMGFALAILSAALGLGQFLTHVIAFQWIFAFVICGILVVLSLLVGVPELFGWEPFKRGAIVPEDREREPLLQDN